MCGEIVFPAFRQVHIGADRIVDVVGIGGLVSGLRELGFGKGAKQPVEPRRRRIEIVERQGRPVLPADLGRKGIGRLVLETGPAQEAGVVGAVVAGHPDLVAEQLGLFVLVGRHLQRQEGAVMRIVFLLQCQNEPALAVRKILLQPLPGKKERGIGIFKVDPVPIFANFLKFF
ncbi:hypothetical protein D3C72_1333660 [compost metagenome]